MSTDQIITSSPTSIPHSSLYIFSLPQTPMRGKHHRTTSSSPTLERVVWQEKKMGRGSKIMGKVVALPQTPKAKKLSTPRSKRRRLEGSSSTSKYPDVEEPLLVDPIPIRLPQVNKRGGKVSSSDLVI